MTPPPVPASAADHEITIAPDVRIPLLGLGVWQLVEGAAGERAIRSALEAYSPLTRGRDLADPVIARVAERLGRTPAQVMLRWGLEHGFIVLPKSNKRERQIENAAIFDFALGADDLAELDALDHSGGTDIAHEHPW
jgi:diketogulonate reductase-like aldo/keto reductase